MRECVCVYGEILEFPQQKKNSDSIIPYHTPEKIQCKQNSMLGFFFVVKTKQKKMRPGTTFGQFI